MQFSIPAGPGRFRYTIFISKHDCKEHLFHVNEESLTGLRELIWLK